MDIKKALVEKLEKDCEVILNQKLKSALDNSNEGSYRNLIKALETNLELIDKYKCRDFVVKELENLKFYNQDEELLGYLPFVYNLNLIDNGETCTLEGDYSNRTGETEISSLLNKNGKSFNYKVKAKGKVRDLFDDKLHDCEFIINNVQISNSSIENLKIILQLIRVEDKPLYMFTISV